MSTLPNTELVMGSARGYRLWSTRGLINHRPYLFPIHQARISPWVPGINQASCILEDKALSTLEDGHITDCRCGYYAKHNPRHLGDIVGPVRSTYVIAGVIHGTGEVAMSEFGFRASQAQIVAISPTVSFDFGFEKSISWFMFLRNIAEYYGVRFFEDFHEMIYVFPQTTPTPPHDLEIHDSGGFISTSNTLPKINFSSATTTARSADVIQQMIAGSFGKSINSISFLKNILGS